MNRLEFILKAKDQYSIQSPFLFDLYTNVIVPKVGAIEMEQLGIAHSDRFSQLLYKLSDHYHATKVERCHWPVDTLLQTSDGDLIGIIRNPHLNRGIEKRWYQLVKGSHVTLSVDIYHTGLVFTSPKLSKQHWLLRG